MVVALDPDARATRLEAFGLALWAFDRLPKGETHGGATGENGATGDLPFRDASSLTAGERAVLEAAVRAGALTGYPDGTVRPTGPVTRAEALTILERLRGKQATGANSGSGGAGTAAGSGTS
ncbi:MAG: S-layer homology domain-containing protein [Clostridia bacterium]|nr:S-layer homology domain-containing protein [Clostridia bacterium]